jgi:hypothetical protein
MLHTFCKMHAKCKMWRTFIIYSSTPDRDKMAMTREQFNAIPLKDLISQNRINHIHHSAKTKILPTRREYLVPPSRRVHLKNAINRLIFVTINHLRDGIYNAMVKAARLAKLHQSTRIRRQFAREREAVSTVEIYFSMHAHLAADSFYYLKQHWDNDVGFSIIPDRYLKMMLNELYIMRHHPMYKEIKDQLGVNDRRKESIADTMATWLAAQPRISTSNSGQHNRLQVKEVHISLEAKCVGRMLYESRHGWKSTSEINCCKKRTHL